MTPTRKKEIVHKLIFLAISLMLIYGVILYALNIDVNRVNVEKKRIEQSVKIHDYPDQID